jgi:hypothetical protein
MRELVGGCVTPYLGLVPPCAVQGRCEATYASLHTWRMAQEKIDASEAITADVFSTVRNPSCQLTGHLITRPMRSLAITPNNTTW